MDETLQINGNKKQKKKQKQKQKQKNIYNILSVICIQN